MEMYSHLEVWFYAICDPQPLYAPPQLIAARLHVAAAAISEGSNASSWQHSSSARWLEQAPSVTLCCEQSFGRR
jgi:hypothetical protein